MRKGNEKHCSKFQLDSKNLLLIKSKISLSNILYLLLVRGDGSLCEVCPWLEWLQRAP